MCSQLFYQHHDTSMAIDLVSVQVILTVTQAQLKVVATRSAAKFLFRLGSNIYADFFQSAIQIQEFHVFITSYGF